MKRNKAEEVVDDKKNIERVNHVLSHQRSREFDELRAQLQKQRRKLVLWRRPFTTLHYFCRELLFEVHRLAVGIFQHRIKVSVVSALIVLFLLSYVLDGPHQPYVAHIEQRVLWATYWIGLGVLSSVGLGTGLHTFLLYLGPFIASVTLAAFTCNSVNFPEPPYPQDIICPDEETNDIITFWTVMTKVRFEAIMWGAGTAIGELPPYFMAKAARLSGHEEEEENYEELEAVLYSQRKDPLTRAKKAIHRLVHKAGFLGILLCASIPNPLFDLAGITCGHFLVPFWTFFGATLIGKAIIKMHIQQMFVILAFSEHHMEWIVELIGNVPYIGYYIQAPFTEYLEKQKLKLHRSPGQGAVPAASTLQRIFGYVILAMVVYFILSIIHSMAQNYSKRLDDELLHKQTHSKTD